MKERDNTQQRKDPHLDIPSEANTDKHINFLDVESNQNDNEDNRADKEQKSVEGSGKKDCRKAESREATVINTGTHIFTRNF